MPQAAQSDEIQKIVKDVMNRTSEFSMPSEPVLGKHGWRVSLLKTGTLNPDLSTTASVDRMRLILESELHKNGYRITGWTQSKFELVADIDRESAAQSADAS